MSRKQTPSDFLKQIIGRPVVVKLNSGVDYRGVLACLDGYMNIALEQTEEYVNGQLKNKYGDAFIRGNNVLYISTQKRKGLISWNWFCPASEKVATLQLVCHSSKGHGSQFFHPMFIGTIDALLLDGQQNTCYQHIFFWNSNCLLMGKFNNDWFKKCLLLTPCYTFMNLKCCLCGLLCKLFLCSVQHNLLVSPQCWLLSLSTKATSKVYCSCIFKICASW